MIIRAERCAIVSACPGQRTASVANSSSQLRESFWVLMPSCVNSRVTTGSAEPASVRYRAALTKPEQSTKVVTWVKLGASGGEGPLSGATRKTYVRFEVYAFLTEAV
jgi:hypothetical protein